MGDLAGNNQESQKQKTSIVTWSQQPSETKAWLRGGYNIVSQEKGRQESGLKKPRK